MATEDKASGMKSAYELALERLEAQGIERPRDEALSEEAKEEIAEIRRRAEASLAHLEILHRESRAKAAPGSHAQTEEEYRIDRRRIEDERDRKIAAVRGEMTG